MPMVAESSPKHCYCKLLLPLYDNYFVILEIKRAQFFCYGVRTILICIDAEDGRKELVGRQRLWDGLESILPEFIGVSIV
jgi:hypothetical protein